MNTLKPPARCPYCGELPASLEKRWEKYRTPAGRSLRYPVAIVATYHCGARIETRYLTRGAPDGAITRAEWHVLPIAGCRGGLDEALALLPAKRASLRAAWSRPKPAAELFPGNRFHMKERRDVSTR